MNISKSYALRWSYLTLCWFFFANAKPNFLLVALERRLSVHYRAVAWLSKIKLSTLQWELVGSARPAFGETIRVLDVCFYCKFAALNENRYILLKISFRMINFSPLTYEFMMYCALQTFISHNNSPARIFTFLYYWSSLNLWFMLICSKKFYSFISQSHIF